MPACSNGALTAVNAPLEHAGIVACDHACRYLPFPREMFMPPQKLQRMHWQGFCRRMSEGLALQRTDIEISSPETGVQLNSRWLPVTGLNYDPRHDLLYIAFEDVGHLTLRPHELYIEISPHGLESFCVLERDNVWQVILLRAPLMLPPTPPTGDWFSINESTPLMRARSES